MDEARIDELARSTVKTGLSINQALRTAVDEATTSLRAEVERLTKELDVATSDARGAWESHEYLCHTSAAEHEAWGEVQAALGLGYPETICPHEHWLDNSKECVKAAVAAVERAEKAEAFKKWVHDWLDSHGVPADPDPEANKKHGCRISGRTQWVWDRLTEAVERCPSRFQIYATGGVRCCKIAGHDGELHESSAGDDGAHRWTENGGKSIRVMFSCRACGKLLLPENRDTIADGCPCNSRRGINHGIVPVLTCTCPTCDPACTGSVRQSLSQGQEAVKATPAPLPEPLCPVCGNWARIQVIGAKPTYHHRRCPKLLESKPPPPLPAACIYCDRTKNELKSRLRDLIRRIGPARKPEDIRDRLEEICNSIGNPAATPPLPADPLGEVLLAEMTPPADPNRGRVVLLAIFPSDDWVRLEPERKVRYNAAYDAVAADIAKRKE